MSATYHQFSVRRKALKKQFIAMITACATSLLPLLLLLALPAVVKAQFTFTTNNGTITITKYIGSIGAVTIPDTINGLQVTSIGNSAFYNKPGVTRISIPDSVTNIGNDVFSGCTSLTPIKPERSIGKGLPSRKRYLFRYYVSRTGAPA